MWRHLSSMAELAGSAEFVGFGHHSGPPVPPPNILAGTLTTEVSYDLVGLRQDLSDQFSVPWQAHYFGFLVVDCPNQVVANRERLGVLFRAI